MQTRSLYLVRRTEGVRAPHHFPGLQRASRHAISVFRAVFLAMVATPAVSQIVFIMRPKKAHDMHSSQMHSTQIPLHLCEIPSADGASWPRTQPRNRLGSPYPLVKRTYPFRPPRLASPLVLGRLGPEQCSISQHLTGLSDSRSWTPRAGVGTRSVPNVQSLLIS